MARLLTLVVLVAVTGWAIYALRAGGGSLRESLVRIVTESKLSLGRLRDERDGRDDRDDQGSSSGVVLVSLRVLFFAIAAASVVVLSLSGFIPYLLIGSVSGVSLVLHVAIAPVFAVCMTAMTLLWAHRHRLDAQDLRWFWSIAQRRNGVTESAGTGHFPAMKMSLWAMVILTPLIMGSIMLSMYPMFGTPGQRSLLTLHLVSGLLFVAAAVAQVVILVGAKNTAMNERQDPRDPAE